MLGVTERPQWSQITMQWPHRTWHVDALQGPIRGFANGQTAKALAGSRDIDVMSRMVGEREG